MAKKKAMRQFADTAKTTPGLAVAALVGLELGDRAQGAAHHALAVLPNLDKDHSSQGVRLLSFE